MPALAGEFTEESFTEMGFEERFKRILPVLACPACKGGLSIEEHQVTCGACNKAYERRNGKIYFRDIPVRSDELDSVKEWLRRKLGKLYYSVGIRVFGATYPFNFQAAVKKFVDPDRMVVIDAGSGNRRIDEKVICVDVFDYAEVDIVSDLNSLPFKANSVSAFISNGVLEHVSDPTQVFSEFYRCTEPGGFSIHLVPFMYPFHASPHDFQRYTHKGMEVLLGSWNIVEQRNTSGPVSLWLVSTIELLAILFSLGSRRLKPFFFLGFCVVLFPIKYLDVLFVNNKHFLSLSPTILTVARKPQEKQSP